MIESESIAGRISGAAGQTGARRVSANFLVTGTAEGVGRLLAFAASIIAARYVGAAGYGIVAFVGGVTLYLAKVSDFGLEAVGTDIVAKNRSGIERIASAILGMRLAATVLLMAVVAAVVQWRVRDPERVVFFAYALTLLPIAASTKWIHLGLEDARPIGLWRVIGEAAAFLIIVTGVRDAGDLWLIPVAVFAGDAIVSAGLWTRLVRLGHRVVPTWNPALARPVFRRALPVMLQFLAGLLIYNMDVIFLRFMRSAEAVGFYAAAYTLIGFVANIATVYGLTLLPTLARLGRRSVEERSLYHTAMAQAFAVTVPIAAGGTFVAFGLIALGFGDGFGPSGGVLQILLWSIVPYALRIVSWAAVVAHGRDMLALRAILYGVGLNAVLNFFLISAYGIYGAAVASVATELLVCGLTLFYAQSQGLPMIRFSRLWRPLVGTVVMGTALWLLRGQAVGLQLAAGMVVYAGTLWSLGAIRLRGWVPALAV